MSDIRTPIYELATEKPPAAAAYRVRDFHNDPTVDIKAEAQRCATLPGVVSSAVEYDWSGGIGVLVIRIVGEELRLGAGAWLVIRRKDSGVHHLDVPRIVQLDCSGRLMSYTDAEFAERYDVGFEVKS